jgi:hypothetical protein
VLTEWSHGKCRVERHTRDNIETSTLITLSIWAVE